MNFFSASVSLSYRNRRMLSAQEKELGVLSTTITIWTSYYLYPIEKKLFFLELVNIFNISLFWFNFKYKYYIEVSMNYLQNVQWIQNILIFPIGSCIFSSNFHFFGLKIQHFSTFGSNQDDHDDVPAQNKY